MCAPSLMSGVREELSRRGFLGLLGASAAVAAAPARAAGQGGPVRLPQGFRDTYDLTHTLSSGTPRSTRPFGRSRRWSGLPSRAMGSGAAT
jgi:hypothetical protein